LLPCLQALGAPQIAVLICAMARTGSAPSANPFSMPPEMECFWLTRPDQQFETERSRSQGRDPRVWEKSTAASRYNSISRLRDEELPMAPLHPALQNELAVAKVKAMDEERPDDTFLTTIATKPAVGLAGPLRSKETDIRSYVQKKREVFLAHMASDVKKAEIVRLEEKAKMKEEALARSQQMLDEDTKKFEEFLQDRLARATKANKDAEAFTKKKQDKLQKIRQIKSRIEGVQSEIGKAKEVREECVRYKNFLLKLTPSEWKDEQRELKLARKAERRKRWISQQMAPILRSLAEEEEQQERKALEESAEAAERSKKRGKARRREEEEEAALREKERQARRKRFQRRMEDEERRIAASYEEVSSEEEDELYFKESHQLMDSFTELEEKNLFLIQSSQETEEMLDHLQNNFDRTKKDMYGKVQQLKDNIRHLERNIAREKQRGEELRRSYAEKAGTQVQDKTLGDLAQKVHDVYVRCGLSADGSLDPLQMLALIESKIEELISGLDEAYNEESSMVMQLEWIKEKERRERLKEFRKKEQQEKQEERLKASWLRSRAPVFKKTGKKIMFRSPPTFREKKEVTDTSEDEAHAQEHKVFGVYIDRRTQMPHTEAPVIEEMRRTSSAPRLVTSASSRVASPASPGVSSMRT